MYRSSLSANFSVEWLYVDARTRSRLQSGKLKWSAKDIHLFWGKFYNVRGAGGRRFAYMSPIHWCYTSQLVGEAKQIASYKEYLHLCKVVGTHKKGWKKYIFLTLARVWWENNLDPTGTPCFCVVERTISFVSSPSLRRSGRSLLFRTSLTPFVSIIVYSYDFQKYLM